MERAMEKTPIMLPDNASVPEMVRFAARSGNITPQIFKELLEIQVAWEKNEAEKEFNAAFARMEFPPIQKTARGVNADYAPYEKIKEIIDPILKSEGFALSFTTGTPDEKNLMPIIGTLLHRMGHSREGVVYQPIGAVSRGMNPNQAMASASTYGIRDCARLLLNLSFIGLDNNAQTFSTINEREIVTIQKLIEESGADIPRFLTWASKQQGSPVKTISDILQGEPYQACFNKLLEKRRQTQEKGDKK